MKKKKLNPTTSGTNQEGLLESKKKTLGRTEKKILIVSSIAILLTFIIGVSYAYIAYTTWQKGINVLETDCINVEMEELTNEIRLTNAYPVTDEVGANTKPFRFKLTNTCGAGVDYNINLEIKESENRINAKNIAAKVDENAKKILNTTRATPSINVSDFVSVEAYTIGNGSINPSESIEHEVRIWLDESATNDSQNGTLYSKVVIEARQNQVVEAYSESILNGADPVLSDNLIPVEIGSDGTVTKANIQNEWYRYEEKKWANAVILEDESISYKDYEVIPEENIESYFVWIPKYSYQLWDLGEYEGLTGIDTNKVHEIPIKFGLNNTSDSVEGECTTPMNEERTQGLSGESGNCKVGDYMTNPAFITMGTNGLWVGKFETGYKGATSAAFQLNANDSTKVQIKPNVYSWGGIQLANAHLTSYNYKRELDSHMMKNTEWGAVAYLQHSKYGSATSVRINNNSGRITGYAAVKEPTCGFTGTNEECNKYENISLGIDGTYTINYKNPASQVASTTGNYSGIYDMSGGYYDYTFSFMMDNDGNIITGKSATFNTGFSGKYLNNSIITNGVLIPAQKYWDMYTYWDSLYDFRNRILGDATGELGPFEQETNLNNQTRPIGSWYRDESRMTPSKNIEFTVRGGDFGRGTGAGIFATDDHYINNTYYYSFRVVLAI